MRAIAIRAGSSFMLHRKVGGRVGCKREREYDDAHPTSSETFFLLNAHQ